WARRRTAPATVVGPHHPPGAAPGSSPKMVAVTARRGAVPTISFMEGHEKPAHGTAQDGESRRRGRMEANGGVLHCHSRAGVRRGRAGAGARRGGRAGADRPPATREASYAALPAPPFPGPLLGPPDVPSRLPPEPRPPGASRSRLARGAPGPLDVNPHRHGH